MPSPASPRLNGSTSPRLNGSPTSPRSATNPSVRPNSPPNSPPPRPRNQPLPKNALDTPFDDTNHVLARAGSVFVLGPDAYARPEGSKHGKFALPMSKALKVLGLRAPRGRSTLKNVTGQVYELTELHEHLVSVHKLYPSTLSGEIMDYSERVLVLCAEPDVADYNRLRFLASVFQPTLNCKAFSPACRECKQAEEFHPWKRDMGTRCREGHPLQEVKILSPSECAICKMSFAFGARMHVCTDCQWSACGQCNGKNIGCLRFVNSGSKVCSTCGSSESAHPLECDTTLECLCSSVAGGYGIKCLLKQLKIYMVYGMWDILSALLQQVGLGGNSEQRGALKWLLTLMFCLVSAVSNPRFISCSGGRNIVTSYKPGNKSAVIVSERYDERQLREIPKTSDELRMFCTAMGELLAGEIHFPDLPPESQSFNELTQDDQSVYSEFVAMLTFANSYRKIFQTEVARDKFLAFFEIEPPQLSVGVFVGLMHSFFESHRASRSLPGVVLEMLCQWLTGGRVNPQINIVTELLQEPPHTTLRIPQITARWVLPMLFDALTVTSDEVAMNVLMALQVFMFRDLTGEKFGKLQTSSAILKKLLVGTDSKLAKILGLTEMLVSKLEACAASRGENLRLPMVFAHHMCQTLIQEKAKYLHRAVSSIEDAECWACILFYVSSEEVSDSHPTSIHQILQLMHQNLPNGFTQAIFDFSVKAQGFSPEIADFNRLRLLAHEFTPISKVGYKCSCAVANVCILAAAKFFVAHGGFNVLLALTREFPNPNFCLLVLQTIWIIGCVATNPTALRCHGRSYVRLAVQSYQVHSKNADQVVRVEDVEFILILESHAKARKIRKPLPELRAFCEGIVELLREEIFWPSFPKLKNRAQVQDAAEMQAITVTYSQVIDLLNVAANYYKVCQMDRARDLFLQFFEPDLDLLQVCRNPLNIIVSEAVEPHRAARTLPEPFLEVLVQLMCGTPSRMHSPRVIQQDMGLEIATEFPVPTIRDGWMLSLVLEAMLAVTNEMSLELLRNLSVCLVSKIATNQVIVRERNFQQWFLPVFFRSCGGKSKRG